MTISFVIKTETFESKIGAISNCSAISSYKQAPALHACLLRAMNAALWSGHLPSSSSWEVQETVPRPQHSAAFQQEWDASRDGDSVLLEERLCMVYRLLWAWSFFLPACSAEIGIPCLSEEAQPSALHQQWWLLVHLGITEIWTWPMALHWPTISLRTQG